MFKCHQVWFSDSKTSTPARRKPLGLLAPCVLAKAYTQTRTKPYKDRLTVRRANRCKPVNGFLNLEALAAGHFEELSHLVVGGVFHVVNA